jgi:cyclopropane fatty-acyl-phospholipid synthase-like methyltransferase
VEDKPFSQACENNKPYILDALLTQFCKVNRVLEIGSGTGQHAIYFAANLPHIDWHCADQYEYHKGINAWINEFPSANLHRPTALSFPDDSLPSEKFDAVFTANTAHIMLAHQVQSMMQKVAKKLPQNGVFCQYGPFIIDGEFSSQSNQDFHHQLLENGCGGYRSIEELQAWAPSLTLIERITMPANNLLLVWHKH